MPGPWSAPSRRGGGLGGTPWPPSWRRSGSSRTIRTCCPTLPRRSTMRPARGGHPALESACRAPGDMPRRLPECGSAPGGPAPARRSAACSPLSELVPEDGGPLELREVDLCVDQWHLIDGDRMALDLVFTPPLGKDNFVVLPGNGTALVRNDLPRDRIDRAGGVSGRYRQLLSLDAGYPAATGGGWRSAAPLLVNRDLGAFHHRTLDLMGVDAGRLMVPAGPALTRFARSAFPVWCHGRAGPTGRWTG